MPVPESTEEEVDVTEAASGAVQSEAESDVREEAWEVNDDLSNLHEDASNVGGGDDASQRSEAVASTTSAPSTSTPARSEPSTAAALPATAPASTSATKPSTATATTSTTAVQSTANEETLRKLLAAQTQALQFLLSPESAGAQQGSMPLDANDPRLLAAQAMQEASRARAAAAVGSEFVPVSAQPPSPPQQPQRRPNPVSPPPAVSDYPSALTLAYDQEVLGMRLHLARKEVETMLQDKPNRPIPYQFATRAAAGTGTGTGGEALVSPSSSTARYRGEAAYERIQALEKEVRVLRRDRDTAVAMAMTLADRLNEAREENRRQAIEWERHGGSQRQQSFPALPWFPDESDLASSRLNETAKRMLGVGWSPDRSLAVGPGPMEHSGSSEAPQGRRPPSKAQFFSPLKSEANAGKPQRQRRSKDRMQRSNGSGGGHHTSASMAANAGNSYMGHPRVAEVDAFIKQRTPPRHHYSDVIIPHSTFTPEGKHAARTMGPSSGHVFSRVDDYYRNLVHQSSTHGR